MTVGAFYVVSLDIQMRRVYLPSTVTVTRNIITLPATAIEAVATFIDFNVISPESYCFENEKMKQKQRKP